MTGPARENHPADPDPGAIVEVMVGNQWHIVVPGTYVEGEGRTQFAEVGTGFLVTVKGDVQAVRSEVRRDESEHHTGAGGSG